MSVVLIFALAGIILILGFLGNYVFRKTGIPDILILILLGIEIGPVLKLVDPVVLAPISPIFSALALIIILFDGGMNLDIKKVIRDSPRAIMLATLCILSSMFLTAYFTHYILGWDFMVGLLLGTIIGGTSSSVVLPLLKGINVEEKVEIVLSLESAFTDALVVVLGLTLLQFLTLPSQTTFSTVIEDISGAFSIAIVLGFVIGIVWLRFLRSIKVGKRVYADIVTLGIVLLFYSITESVGGNGAIFALMFGLILGNGIRISRAIGIRKAIEASRFMRRFESEISFLIKTFFFVYLGLIFSVANLVTFLYALAIMALLFFGRYVSVLIATLGNKEMSPNRDLMGFMLPRGLAAAVLAQIVVNAGVPGTSLFPDIILLIIIYSVIIASLGIFIIKKRRVTPTIVKQK